MREACRCYREHKEQNGINTTKPRGWKKWAREDWHQGPTEGENQPSQAVWQMRARVGEDGL